jgi:hypothetical protein
MGTAKQRTPCGGKLSGADQLHALQPCASRFPLALFWRSILLTLFLARHAASARLHQDGVLGLASNIDRSIGSLLCSNDSRSTRCFISPSHSTIVLVDGHASSSANPSAAARVTPLWTYLLVSTSTLTLQPGLLPTWLDRPDWIHSPHSVSWILLPLVAIVRPLDGV